MDSWTVKKRPWEEENPIDPHPKRQESTTATARRPPPPPHAGDYSRDSHDSQNLNQRRLPPLYTPSFSESGESFQPGPIHLSAPVPDTHGWDTSRPRSQSLFNIFQQPKRQRLDSDSERTVALPGVLELDRSLPPISSDARRPRFGTDPAPHAAGEVICCPSNCEGQACLNTRTLMRKLASELVLLDSRVRSISRKDYHSSADLAHFEHVSTEDSLQWALDLVQWTNINIREHLDHSAPNSPAQSLFQPDTLLTMRRGHHPSEREEQSSPGRQLSGSHHGYSGFTHPGAISEDSRRNPYGGEIPPMAGSPHHTASSSGSIFMPPQSPMQAPQPSRSAMLPSPSSMNFTNIPNLPPISPPSTAVQSSAQAAHLQDLQHQVSIKTLAFQTLQREYDSLLQKLERQRTKSATLEKKFEVSDVEINSLTDEKEKLQAQVIALETQVEELQHSRDEARRQLVANGAQYMRIMEMANRLQAQSADDKKRWEVERSDLEQRIRVLEEAMVTGQASPKGPIGESTRTSGASPPPSMILAHTAHASPSTSSSTETINVLRSEIGRLRSRTQTLENALHAIKEDSVSIQSAARQLVESSGKIEKAASLSD